MIRSAHITYDDHEVLEVLSGIIRRLENPTELMSQIGEALIDSTKRRFATSTSPSGKRWAPDRASTVTRYIESVYGRRGKAFSARKSHRGELTKFGLGAAMMKKPLIGETKRLSSKIFYHVSPRGSSLSIGSSLKYAAAQQFGMEKGYAGRTKHGTPIPWGTIPARPYLDVSHQDRQTILDLARNWLL